MAYVVAEPCLRCRYTECVTVCPVDCFYEGATMLVIHPEECIDCGACAPVCPTNAIFPEAELPEKWAQYKELNAKYATLWPRITVKQDPLPDADHWATVENKSDQFDERPGGEAEGAPASGDAAGS